MAASPAIQRFRIVLWGLVVIAAVAATAFFFLKPPAQPVGVTGSPFAMSTTAGGTFTQDDLNGTPSLVFFGYTFCPDVCPTTMAELASYKKELGLGQDKLRTIFVTVDPARDTPQALKDYLGSFDPAILGLYGTADQTTAAKASFGVFSENGMPDKDGNYAVNHTADVFLIGRDGRYVGTIAYGEDKASAEAKMKRLVAG
jgi:protein SCO1/2